MWTLRKGLSEVPGARRPPPSPLPPQLFSVGSRARRSSALTTEHDGGSVCTAPPEIHGQDLFLTQSEVVEHHAEGPSCRAVGDARAPASCRHGSSQLLLPFSGVRSCRCGSALFTLILQRSDFTVMDLFL